MEVMSEERSGYVESRVRGTEGAGSLKENLRDRALNGLKF